MSKPNDIVQQIDDIDQQIEELQNQRNQLSHKLPNMYGEKLSILVGRCFYMKDLCYAKITGTPEYVWDGFHSIYSPTELPAVWVCTDSEGMSVYIDTVHSKACYADDPLAAIQSEYDEITLDEFNKNLDTVVSKFKSKGVSNG